MAERLIISKSNAFQRDPLQASVGLVMRWGSPCAYSQCCRFSELRIVELLDGICDIISEYELAGVVSDPGSQPTWQWLHPKSKHSSNSTKLDKPQLKQQQRRLQNYCAQLIDKAEEGLSSALQKGLSSAGTLAAMYAASTCLLDWPTKTWAWCADLQSLLCTELSKDCQPPSEQSVQHTEL